MKKAKRILAFLLAISCVITAAVNPLRSNAAESISKVNVQVWGEGGKFQIAGATYESWAYMIDVGQSMKDLNNSIEADPVFFDSTRRFEGWLIGAMSSVADEYGNTSTTWVQFPNTSLMTTEEICNYKMSADQESVIFRAQYAGDDEDYYANIQLDMFGGMMEIKNYQGYYDPEVGNYVDKWVPSTTDKWSTMLRKDGTTIKDQTKDQWDFSAEPTKSSAKFEGWVQVRIIKTTDANGASLSKCERVSDNIYSTEQILAMVPSEDTVFTAKWSDIDVKEYYWNGPTREVSIQGEGGTFEYKFGAEESGWNTSGCGFDAKATLPLSKSVYSVTEPVYSGSDRKFLGWKICEWKETTDENGNTNADWVQIPGTKICTTKEMMDYVIPEGETAIGFFAQWEGKDSDTSEPGDSSWNGARRYIQIDGNGGTYAYEDEDGEKTSTEFSGFSAKVTLSVSEVVKKLSDPVFFDKNRKFLGWKICEMQEIVNPDDGGMEIVWEQIPGTKICSTKEVMDYVIPDGQTTISFIAQWNGDDDQYYSAFCLNLYHGQMDITHYEEEWDNSTEQSTMKPVTDSVPGWSTILRRDGSTIKSQLEDYDFSAIPTKVGATFEGWLEFKPVADGYKLVSDKIYTTNEMLNKVVPAYDVVFVPKWSDLSVDDYFAPEIANYFNTDGGIMVTTELDAYGNLVTNDFCGITSMFHAGKPTMKEYLESAKYSINSMENTGYTFDGWTVIEYENLEPVRFPVGTEPNIGDPDMILVYGGTFYNYDSGIYENEWLALFNYYKYPNKMTTEEIMKLDGTKNHYFMANWKEETTASDDVTISVEEDTVNSVNAEVDKLVQAIRSGKVTSEMRKLYSEQLINAIADAIKAGDDITTEIAATVVSEDQVNAAEAEQIKKSLGKDGKIAQYLELSILIKSVSSDGTEKELGTLKQLEKEVTFTITIPEKLMKEGREFFVLRNHEGNVDKLALNKNVDETYSFKTDRFSTYALAYEDVKSTTPDEDDSNVTTPDKDDSNATTPENKVPYTGDTSVLLYGTFMVMGLAAIVVSKKRIFK